MKEQLWYGALAVLVSAPASLIPRALGLGGEDWLATATMRYLWAIVFLSCFVRFKFGPGTGKQVVVLFRRHAAFWVLWSVVSGPLLFVPGIYVAALLPAWIIAVTLRLKILTTIVVLRLFGQRVEREKTLILSFVFLGMVLITIEHTGETTWQSKSMLAIALLVATVLLDSLSEQMMQDSRWGREGRPRWIPHINSGVGTSSHCWLLILYLLSLPQLAIGLVVHPVLPSWKQVWATAIMAACTSLISSALWMKIRLSAGTSANHIALTDATLALGIVSSVLAEVWLFEGPWPGLGGFAGIACVIGGLVWYVRR